nr:immunoglobulin heavy chain junction region [Macaca mulatta]
CARDESYINYPFDFW